jgi:opacity protein-like surface antigen
MGMTAGRGHLLASAATLGLAAAISATPALALGPYGSIFGGANVANDMTFTSSDDPFSYNPRTLHFQPGTIIGAAIGNQFGPIRGEGEASFRWNGVNGVTVQGEGNQSAIGSVGVFALMANGWFDFPGMPGVTPYVGGGVGPALIHLKAQSTDCCSEPLIINSSLFAFAYQVGAGARVHVPGTSIAVSLDYRFFATSSFTLPIGRGAEGSASYSAHSVMVGLTMPLMLP